MGKVNLYKSLSLENDVDLSHFLNIVFSNCNLF